MSLIEVAIERAKKIAGTDLHRTAREPLRESTKEPEEPPVVPRGEARPHPDAAAVAARTAQARVLPVAGVDANAMERNGVLLHVTDTAAQRSYRILRTRVQQRMQAQGWHSLAVTASGVGEGKTLTAINLAISLARDINTWVYLVDLDLQRPMVSTYLGLKFEKGLSDYLAGNASFDEILYNPGAERLGIIPNSQRIEHSSDLLGSPRLRELCQSLAAERPRPLVIFDLPPILMSDDVLKVAPHVDCTLFVVSEGLTSRSMLQRASEALQDMNLLGVVLNRSAEQEQKGYY